MLVGGDEILPFWRADDDRYACSYQADACEDAHWASGNSPYGVLWNAYDDNYFLTDNVYADIGGAVVDWEKGNLEMAVGRIAGRNAAQMRYLISNGYNRTRSLLAGGVASIEGIDVDRIVAAMDSRDVSTIGGSNPDLTENNGWTAAQFADVWRTDWQMFFFGGHANPWTVASGNGQSIPNVDLEDSEIDVNHPLFVSAGCNLAVPIATNADGTVKGIVYHLVDQGTAGIIGSTGISHFINRIPERQVGGEKLTSDVLSLLLSGNSQTLPFGEALRRAKADFNPVDPVGAKTMLEYVYYGLPWASTSIPPTSAQALNHDAGHDFQIEASPPQSVDSVTTRTYSFDVSSYNLVDLDGYTLLAMDQAENIADSEWPALPLVVHTVILPQGSTIANITLNNETAQSLGSRDLVSLLPQTTYDTSSSYMPFDGTGVYPSGNRFSYRIVEHPEFTAVEITVYLGTYNSDTRELTLYNHTELQLEYVADQPVVIKSFDLSQPVYTPGESVEASARIENVTDQARELTGLLAVVDSNNETVVALEVDSLTVGAGQETTLAVPIPASLSHGTYSAELRLFEANVMVAQGGNTFTVEDGQITGFDVPAQAYAGEGAPIAIRFRNLGLLDAYLLANISILDQGIEVGKLVSSAATVAPGEEGSITWSWDPTGLSSGTYTLRPVVMAGNMSYFAPDAQIEVISDGPDITMFSPSSGPIGTLVTISGTNLINTTSVTFNGTPAVAVNIVSATEITAIVPTGATTGKIAVTTLGGTATSTADFTIIPPPTISGFSPTSGPAGTSVTISGTAFNGATAVTFNGVNAASFTVNSATQITALVPAGATTGKLAVTTPGGTATSAADFTVTTAPPFPDVFYLSPSANVTIGGIAAQGADVLHYTRSTNSWTMVFDGSNHGLTKNVSAFTFLDDGSLLFVLAANQTIAGLGAVTPYDVIKFTPNAPGVFPLGTGTYSWYAQLKPKGLTTAGEKIDAIDVADNRLLLSTGGAASVPKPGGGVLKPADEDVFVYNLGTGAFEITLLIDGSKMPGMAVEDITGIWDDPQSSDYYITIVGAFNLGGVKGNDKSIVKLTPNGGASVYTPSLVSWLAAGATLPTGFKIDGIEIAR